MPRNGYRSITVKEEVYCALEKLVNKNNRTIPEVIESIILFKKEA